MKFTLPLASGEAARASFSRSLFTFMIRKYCCASSVPFPPRSGGLVAGSGTDCVCDRAGNCLTTPNGMSSTGAEKLLFHASPLFMI